MFLYFFSETFKNPFFKQFPLKELLHFKKFGSLRSRPLLFFIFNPFVFKNVHQRKLQNAKAHNKVLYYGFSQSSMTSGDLKKGHMKLNTLKLILNVKTNSYQNCSAHYAAIKNNKKLLPQVRAGEK